MPFQIQKVSPDSLDEILDFSQKFPWKTKFPIDLIRMFLTELISAPIMIIDLHDENGRASTAVLLDKVNNPKNDANLEILGLRSDIQSFETVLATFLDVAKKRVPPTRSGILVTVPEEFPFEPNFFSSRNFGLLYSSYEMENLDIKDFPVESNPVIEMATKSDCDEVFKILTESFKENLETSSPDLETWRTGFLRSPLARYLLLKQGGKIVGFANLIRPENGDSTEIRTLGVLSSSRGQGFGQHLLKRCLSETKNLGFSKCHLSVAAENDRALGMYTRFGFRIIETFRCYQLKTNSLS